MHQYLWGFNINLKIRINVIIDIAKVKGVFGILVNCFSESINILFIDCI